MKKEARNKLNAKSQKSGFLRKQKNQWIFKTDFNTIIHTSTLFYVRAKSSEFRYTFLSISVHFSYILHPHSKIGLPFLKRAFCSFEHKLSFQRAFLYLETSYHLTFIQTYLFSKAIFRAKHLHFE